MLQWRRETFHYNKLHSLLRILHFHIYSITPFISTPIKQPLTEIPIKESIFTLCQSGQLRKALEFVDSSNHHGITSDPETYASLLQKCADENALEEGHMPCMEDWCLLLSWCSIVGIGVSKRLQRPISNL
ncbi:hypothetical protein SUGI_0715790 [Cryptomeria japonica]|nr:hypothetical protein SUGI_0715790 [Cryptomeria japonica]